MKLKLCRYHDVCAHFRDSAHTCWHEDEAKTYCGLFRIFAIGQQERAAAE